MVTKAVGVQQSVFLKFELDNGDARRKKAALQEVARLYRQGYRFQSEYRNAFAHSINGLVLQKQQDRKVVRWCLNVVAQLGTRQNSSQYVHLALQQYDGDPEISAAGIAALTSLYNGKIDEIDGFTKYDPEMRILAALQNTPPSKLDLDGFKINIDKAHPETLKLALITVGLNKDIENLFDPRHNNGSIVKALAQYPDPIVVQYSVWSVIENKKLSMADLGIQIRPLDNHKPNVQSKLMQLVVSRETDIRLKHDIIADGPYLECLDARDGLAKGLLGCYYDGLEEVTISWFDQEPNHSVRLMLAEHFAKYADGCPIYEEKALSILTIEPSFRKKLLAGAEGSKLYGKLRSLDIGDGTGDMFGYGTRTQNGLILPSRGREVIVNKTALILSASPIDQTPLRLDQEARDLKEQLQLVRDTKSTINVIHEWAVRTDQIQGSILNNKPNILHFSGHGSDGSIYFEDRNGESAPVSEEAFSELISLNTDCIECVILNSCYSSAIAESVKPHVKAVIGCDASIADDAAIAFSRAFYRALAHGRDYESAYRLARNEVKMAGMDAEAEKYVLA